MNFSSFLFGKFGAGYDDYENCMMLVMTMMMMMDMMQGSLEEWLRLLRLEEYGPCLVSQGYSTVQEVATISIEDLEVSSGGLSSQLPVILSHETSISRTRVLNAFSSVIVFTVQCS